MSDDRIPEVVPLDQSEIVDAGEMLGRAFSADPLWAVVFPDPDSRHARLVEMFTGLIRTAISAHGVVEKTRGLAGVALWLPPGRDTGFLAMAKAGFALPRFMMSLPGPDRKRMSSVLQQVDERRKALMPELHWYVGAIGVDPEFQGKGLGSALMERGIARADSDRKPVYLETETERNVGFYQSLGFEVVEEFTPSGLDTRMWLMARPGGFADREVRSANDRDS